MEIETIKFINQDNREVVSMKISKPGKGQKKLKKTKHMKIIINTISQLNLFSSSDVEVLHILAYDY